MSFRNLFLALLALSWLNAACAQDALLHLRCEGEAAGSYVFINGKAQGKCPAALVVAAGPVKLKVMKMLDLGHYRHFTTELSLAAGTKQSVTVVIGDEILLTPQGRKELNQQLAAAKAKAAPVAPMQQSTTRPVASSAPQPVRVAAPSATIRQQQEQQRQLQQQEQLRLQQQQQAVIAQQAEVYSRPSEVKTYLDSMSTKGNAEGNPSSATIATSYAPIILPMATTSDIFAGNAMALTDPAGFGNPDSMVAKAIRLQEQRTHQEPPVAVAQR